MTAAIAAVVLAGFVLGSYALACLAWREWAAGRAAIVLGFVVILASVALAGEEILGRPKPVEFELRNSGDTKLIAWTMQEGVAIWLWVAYPGADEPMAYRLPWSPGKAQSIVEAEIKAGELGTGVMVDLDGPPGEPMAWPEPVQAPPPKDAGG